MTITAQRPRAARGARRFGYVVAGAVNIVMLYLIHAWPGWDVVPILTDKTTEVLPYVDASIVATILANAVYVARDDRVAKACGDLVTNLVSMLSLIRFWQVFPFDFDGVWAGWQPLTYVLLTLATLGTAIGALAQVITLFRPVAGPTVRRVPPGPS